MDEQTVPFGQPELWRVSAFQRATHEGRAAHTLASSFSPSLMADLQRFEQDGLQGDILSTVAACLRHAQDAALHLDRDGHVLPLTVFARERLFHTPLPIDALYATRFDSVRLIEVERALLQPPTGDTPELRAPHAECHPLHSLLWHLALHGQRHMLLPEIAGPAVYRIAADVVLPAALGGALQAAAARMQQDAVSLRTIASWPGMDRERAARLLNGLYLQAGVIVSRTHPDAAADSWFGGIGNW